MVSNKHIYQVGFLILIVSSLMSHLQPAAGHGNGNDTDSTNSSNNSQNGTSRDPNAVNEELILLFNIIVSTIGALSNSLLIIVMIIDPLRNLHKGAWVTILNLAFADLITTVGAILSSSIPRLQLKLSERQLWRSISDVVLNSGYSASFFFLTLLNVEVFVITKYPLHCKSILTKTKVCIACAFAWLLGIALGCLGFITEQFELAMKLLVAWIGILEFAVLIQVILKILIILEIVKSRKSLSNSYMSGKHKNVAKTVIILNALLMFTAFPYFVSLQIWYMDRLEVIDVPVVMNQFAQYYFPVGLISSAVNPLVYAWRLPEYRRTLLACSRKRRTSSRSSGKDTQLQRYDSAYVKTSVFEKADNAESPRKTSFQTFVFFTRRQRWKEKSEVESITKNEFREG